MTTSIYSQTKNGFMLFLGFLLLGFSKKNLIRPIFSKLVYYYYYYYYYYSLVV